MRWGSAPHTIADIRDWRSGKKLEIRPDYQRRSVWSKVGKIQLIDTIIKNIPMPKIYLETKYHNGTTYRVVIDGQQRLTAIFDYLDDKITMPNNYEDARFAGIPFSELDEELQEIILNYNIDTNELKNPSEEEVRDLYSRVNKYTVQLNNQELRRADYKGDFISLAEQLSEDSFFEDAKLFSAQMTRRMLDVEFIEELLCILIDGIQNKKTTLDIFCDRYRDMSAFKDTIKSQFDNLIEDITQIFTINGDFMIAKTRFRQRADFYTIVAVLNALYREKYVLDKSMIEELQSQLRYLDAHIEPLADEEEFREYAIRCTSDANSSTSRNWRMNFLRPYFEKAYRKIQ